MDDLDNKIDKYLSEMNEHDPIEEISGRKNIGKAIEKLREKKKELKEAEIKTNSSGMNEISLTDPEER